MIISIFLTLIVTVVLGNIFLDVCAPLFEMFFPKTISMWELRKKRIELDKLEQENLLLGMKKEAIEKQKALEDFLKEHNL